ncbi:TPA: hypothetical protein ACHW7I_001970 [Legionella pneumophila]|nr:MULTISPECIES: hypothetical protein [Gammaproteobacteria]MCZ4804127.1 hypothetical protein [Legionella pneumophila]MDI9850519.1 hypothetical protein [Legionella pneumophila]MDW8853654.1 hypothetical protein [Legionella pneumophila]MDW8867054.1 hypothetical protein [Legionella pneumophila]MDW8920953.1 hypothetical protein [Legionella pneumophila]
MSDPAGKLKTPKFKKLRGKPGEYFKEFSALPIMFRCFETQNVG